jgi:hypothetical protein
MTQPTERPSFGLLCDWLEGRLDAETAAGVAAAVEADEDGRLQGSVAWLTSFLTVSRELPLSSPPPLVRQRLNQYFSRWSKAREAMSGTPVVVPADLLFDSRKDLVGAGMRSGSADAAVHLGFISAVADIVLDARPTPDGLIRVDGQVLPTRDTAPVFAATFEAPSFSATVLDGDEFGHFGVGGVPRESVEVRLSNGEVTVVLQADLRDVP